MRRQIINLAGALALAAAPLTSQALAQTGGNLPFATQQSANEFLAGVFIGQAVHNTASERLGDVNDLAFDRKGQISTVVMLASSPSIPGPFRWVSTSSWSLPIRSSFISRK
jgi:hypothetical protein